MNSKLKALVAFFIICFCVLTTQAQQLAIPDIEFEKALIAQGIHEGPLDGFIYQEDAEAFTGTLNISTSGESTMSLPIRDLTGIEAFVNITGLDASPSGAEIHTMDLSNNTELEYVNLLSAVSISDLDFSNNTKLKDLRVSASSLTDSFDSINVSNLNLLEHLEVSLGLFDTLDLSDCTSLKEIYLKDNIALTGVDFVQNDMLNSIIIENCTSLTTLDNLPNPQVLTVRNGSLSTLDLSGMTNLSQLNLANNSLTSLNLQNGNNNTLFVVDISQNQNLLCVLIDDVTLPQALTSWAKDDTTFYNDVSCDLVAIPDSEFERRIINAGYDSTNQLDGYILAIDAEEVSGIFNLSEQVNSGMVDYTGIEAFVNINGFIHENLENDNIQTLDLSNNELLEKIELAFSMGISNYDFTANTNLQELAISDNISPVHSINLQNLNALEKVDIVKASFNAIDLSTNINLKDLSIENASSLIGLNVSNNSLLETLTINNSNALISIDLNSNTELNVLNVNDCNSLVSVRLDNGQNENITALDLRFNENLICVQVDDIAYSNTNWTEKEPHTIFSTICDLVDIPDTEFERRLISLGIDSTNKIDGYVLKADAEAVTGTFDASEEVNEGMTDYTGIEAFINITGFIHENIENDNIQTLDLSNNTNLEIIELWYTMSISDYDFTTNANLRRLRIIDNFAPVATLNIQNLTALKRIDLTKASLNSLDVSSNINLDDLRINSANNLSNLYLGNNVLLKKIRLDNCGALENIDLHKNNVLNSIFIVDCNVLKSIRLDNGNNENIPGPGFYARFNDNLSCVKVDDEDYANTNWDDIDSGLSFTEGFCNPAPLSLKVFLQGATLNPNLGEENWMRDDLRIQGFIPTSSPYADGVTCDASVFNTTGSNAIIDWLWVELRSASNPTQSVSGSSALLQRDGDVVDVDGISNFTTEAVADDYYVVIKHRNHLGVMTLSPVALSSNVLNLNFTDAQNPITYGNNAQTTFGMPTGILGMWAGDSNNDGRLNYVGSFSENPSIRNQIFSDPNNSVFGGPPVGTFASPGYFATDIDMNGFTKYQGSTGSIQNDSGHIRNNIFANSSNSVFGSPPVPTFVFTQQLPEGAN